MFRGDIPPQCPHQHPLVRRRRAGHAAQRDCEAIVSPSVLSGRELLTPKMRPRRIFPPKNAITTAVGRWSDAAGAIRNDLRRFAASARRGQRALTVSTP
jgi:hypothetical protein